MSEQLVLICSEGEEDSVRSLCSALEEQGLTCWSPVREEDAGAAMWTLPSKLRSARALILITRNANEHSDAIENAALNKVPVVVTEPDDGRWDGVFRELADALGLAGEWLSNRSTSPGAQPKTHLAEDEEEFLEFIAENVSEAQVFVRFGLFGHAVARLEKVFAKAPRNLEAHDELFKIYLEEEDWKKAAATAADFLDCLLFRGDSESYAILRAHLTSRGFSVQDGPPVAVGYGEVEPIPTKYFDKKPAPPPPQVSPAPAPAAREADPDPVSLELPALRNFKSAQPVFQSSGVESELSGVDFFIDHGMIDEARIRIEQIHHDHPDHPGVIERRARIAEIGGAMTSPGIALELDDPWEAAAKVGNDSSVDTLFDTGRFPVISEPETFSPADGPVGEGDSLICTAFVPERVDPGDMFVVRVCVHTAEQTDGPMLESPYNRRESNMLARNISKGESIVFMLELPGLELDEASLSIDWTGEPDSVEFGVVVPFTQSTGTITGMLSVRAKTGPAGDFAMTIPIS